jgi:hypothetical protein
MEELQEWIAKRTAEGQIFSWNVMISAVTTVATLRVFCIARREEQLLQDRASAHFICIEGSEVNIGSLEECPPDVITHCWKYRTALYSSKLWGLAANIKKLPVAVSEIRTCGFYWTRR